MHFLKRLIKKKSLKRSLTLGLAAGCLAGVLAVPNSQKVEAKSASASTSAKRWAPFTFYRNNDKKAGKLFQWYMLRKHTVKGVPIGGSSSKWTNDSVQGNPMFRYTPHVGDQGSNGPGVLYKNALILYDARHEHKPQILDIQLRLKEWNIDSVKTKANGFEAGYVLFHQNSIAISHGATGQAVYTISFYKNGQPFKIPGGYPISFWDIDEGQGMGLGSGQTTILGAPDTSTYYVEPGKYGANRYALFGFGNPHHRKDARYNPRGTVDPSDSFGGMTWLVQPQGNTLNVTYSFNGNERTAKRAADAIKNAGKGSHKDDQGGAIKIHKSTHQNFSPGNLFTIGFNKVSVPPIISGSDKDSGKDGGKLVNKDGVGHKWLTKLDGLKFDVKNPSATKFYYNLWSINVGPHTTAGKPAKPSEKDISQAIRTFTFTDNNINPGLEIDKIGVYYEPYKGAKYKKLPHASEIFAGLTPKGHKIDVHIKKGANITADNWTQKARYLFNTRVHLVFRVHGTKRLASAFTKNLGNGKYKAHIGNTGMITTDYGKVKKKVYVDITTKSKPANKILNETHGVKDVHRLKKGVIPTKDPSDGDVDWQSFNYGTVTPGQHILYTLHFKIKKPKTQGPAKFERIKELTIKDKLDSNIQKVNQVYVSEEYKGKTYKMPDASGTLTIKMPIEKYKKLLMKYSKDGGDLYVRFQAYVKEGKPNGDEIDNQATLSGKTQGVKVVNNNVLMRERGYKEYTVGKTTTRTYKTAQDKEPGWNNPEVFKDVSYLGHPKSDSYYKQKAQSKVDGEMSGYTITSKEGPKLTKSAKWGNTSAPKFPTAKTNKTVNYFEVPPIKPPVKDYKDSQNYDNTTVTHDSTGEFTVSFQIGALNTEIGAVPKKIVLSDNVDKRFFEVKSGVKILDPSGVNVVGKFTNNSKGNDVNYSIEGKKAISKLNLKGGTYKMIIPVKSYLRHVVHEWSMNNVAERDEITGGVPINQKTNKLELGVQNVANGITKQVTSVHDDWTGSNNNNVDPQTVILNPQDPYTIHYHIEANLGNNYDNANGFTIKDQMPEHTHLVDTPAITVDKEKGYGETDYGTGANGLSANVSKGSGTDGDSFTIHGSGKQFFYTTVNVDYDVKVEPEADWSDYYNSSKYYNATVVNNNGLDHVTDDSYIRIPNDAHLVAGGDDEASFATFNMGIQTFHTKQLIVQDDDNWTDNLDPSHYLPHTRNDRTAVTTAVKVTMPNYLKLSKTEFTNEAKTHGFDKGEVHILRANLNLVHNEKLLKNPDFTKSGYATADPYEGEWANNITTGNAGLGNVGSDDKTGPKNLQDTAGKTFYRFTKWAPKTKYYKDYAKLGDMRTGFKANVKLAGSSVGGRRLDSTTNEMGPEKIDDTYDDNDVAIHLSNIYRYMTMMDSARIDDNGQSLDYRLYGEFKGLAVDKNHPTDFGKEGQPIKAWIDPDPNKYKSIGANAKTVPINNNKLMQGQTYDSYARWEKLPYADYTGKNIIHAYNSNSALTEEKGHSVTLTNDLVDDVKGYNADGQNGQGMYSGVSKALPLDNQTLVETRFDNDIHYDKLKRQIINKSNSTYTNPREYRIYYDFNKDFDGKDLYRVFREAYEMFARNEIKAKAGYGLTETHKLLTYNYYEDHNKDNQKREDNDHAYLLNHYKTNIASPDKIFDNGYMSNANSEYLDLTHIVVHDKDKSVIDANLSNGNKSNVSVDDLIDAKTANMPLAKSRIAWAKQYQEYVDKKDTDRAYIDAEFIKDPTLFTINDPEGRLTDMNYRFNKRVLNDGEQALDVGKYDHDIVTKNGDESFLDQRKGDYYNAYRNDNTNRVGIDWATTMAHANDGGYRNYLKSWIRPGDYRLNFTSQPFGVGNMISIRYTQNLGIYGHRFLTQEQGANSSAQDEINPQPAISGKDGQNIGNNSSINQWLKNNDQSQSQITKTK